MATGGEDVNVAFVALREHFEELLTAIQEPEALVAGLFTRGVVTKNLMDEVGRGYRVRRIRKCVWLRAVAG